MTSRPTIDSAVIVVQRQIGCLELFVALQRLVLTHRNRQATGQRGDGDPYVCR